MNEFLLSLLLYGQMVLGGTAIVQDFNYIPYSRPKIIQQWTVDTRYFEYIGSIKVGEELKPLFTLRQEEI